MIKESLDHKKKGDLLWSWVKAISTLTIVGVISYKIYSTPVELTVDFPTLLSLLLALFSVGLSALFYFKATETSNTFYNNTNKFTKEIAELLVRIESGFGEKLRNLDEGYSSIRDSFQYPNRNIELEKENLETERKEKEKLVEERNKIISELIEKANLQEEEKLKVTDALLKKEKELFEAQEEIDKFNKQVILNNAEEIEIALNSNLEYITFTKSYVLNVIGVSSLLNMNNKHIIMKFNSLASNFPNKYISDLKSLEYFNDNSLTNDGADFLKSISRHLTL